MSSPYIAFIRLAGFYANALQLASDVSCVIAREKQVLDLNERAGQRGVTVLMSLSEAKTLLGKDGHFVEWAEEPYRLAQSSWLDICTRYSDCIEPLDQHEAFVDLSNHPNPYDIQEHLRQELKQLDCGVKIGASSCRWIAQAAATHSSLLAIHDPQRFIARLPVHELPIDSQHRKCLDLLGCRFIGEVATMPMDVLRKQFGKAAFDIKRYAKGQGEAKVSASYPANTMADRFRFDGGASDLQVFDNGLKHLSSSLGLKLVEADLSSEFLEVWLEDEDGDIAPFERRFTKPIGSPASLLISLRLLIGSPKKSISTLRVRVGQLKKKKRVQTSLESLVTGASHHVAAESALAHVKAAFGDVSIVKGSEIIAPRWKQVRTAWRSANGWTWR
ncbi:MAG: hypothetical protein H7Y17_14310 [Chlorobia bacterium]|nr:hypothetical protein [Fimbriimonadaceae bacterium]